jgi:hypothetical protein
MNTVRNKGIAIQRKRNLPGNPGRVSERHDDSSCHKISNVDETVLTGGADAFTIWGNSHVFDGTVMDYGPKVARIKQGTKSRQLEDTRKVTFVTQG